MDINRTNLDNLYIGFNGAFNGAFLGYESLWGRVAMQAGSASGSNQYPFLRQMSGMREWLGDRQIAGLEKDGFQIQNKLFEKTIGVPRTSIEDDTFGVFKPMFEDLGQTSAEQADRLVFALLKAAFATVCFDGQYFCDTDHPVIASDGSQTTYSNSQGGASYPWFLMCTKRAIKPLIKQDRRTPALTRMDQGNDPNVFMKGEYLYGTDWRGNAGYGVPQLVVGSKQALTQANYEAARATMFGMFGDYGRPLNIMPDLLVVHPNLEGAAKSVVGVATMANGATNPWVGTADILVAPLLQ